MLKPPWGAGHPWVPGEQILLQGRQSLQPPIQPRGCEEHSSFATGGFGQDLTQRSVRCGVTQISPFYPICLIFKDGKRWSRTGDRGAHGGFACSWLSRLMTVQCLSMNLLEAIIKNKY